MVLPDVPICSRRRASAHTQKRHTRNNTSADNRAIRGEQHSHVLLGGSHGRGERRATRAKYLSVAVDSKAIVHRQKVKVIFRAELRETQAGHLAKGSGNVPGACLPVAVIVATIGVDGGGVIDARG